MDEKVKAEVERRRMIYNSTHTASEVSKIPETAHFAVLCNESMRYDDGYGDDRMGASYSTLSYISYIYFDTETALSAWIIENNHNKSFRVINVKPVEFELKTTIVMKD